MPFFDILVKLICTRSASLTLLLFLNCSMTRGTSTGWWTSKRHQDFYDNHRFQRLFRRQSYWLQHIILSCDIHHRLHHHHALGHQESNDHKMVRMVIREEGLPEELLALMEDMKNAQKRANQVRYLWTEWSLTPKNKITFRWLDSLMRLIFSCTG